jgi:hypothetical protein
MSSSPQVITENIVRELSDQGPAGGLFGASATDLIAFYGATPIAQQTSSLMAAVVTTTPTSTSPYGFTLAQATAIITLVNELRLSLVNLGLIKGS